MLYVFHALDEKISEAGRSEIPENIRSKMYNLAVEANEEINSKIQKFEKALEKEEQAAAALDAAIDQYDTDTTAFTIV